MIKVPFLLDERHINFFFKTNERFLKLRKGQKNATFIIPGKQQLSVENMKQTVSKPQFS